MLRELPVAWLDGATDTEGFVDIAFEEDDGWVLLDYKTDRADGREHKLVRRCAPQVAMYRNALEAASVKLKEAGLGC